MSAALPTDASLLQPLTEFYLTAGRKLPWHQAVAGEQIPEPQRTLLVHDRDMTSTLEQFHGSRIHLRLVSLEIRGNILHRQVVLSLDAHGEAVEFGAIRVDLDRFQEPWRSEIVASRRPLGGILNASGRPYVSRPSAFLELEADDFLCEVLRLRKAIRLYGRQNTLRTPDGLEIAEIIEILPPGVAALSPVTGPD